MVYTIYILCYDLWYLHFLLYWCAIPNWPDVLNFGKPCAHKEIFCSYCMEQYGVQIQFCNSVSVVVHYCHWRQTGRKSGGAEWEFETYLVKFETYLVKFETYSVLWDYKTKKKMGAPAPAAPASLAPMVIIINQPLKWPQSTGEFRSNFSCWESMKP